MKLPVPVFSVAIFPVPAVKVVITAVIAFRIFAVRFPVTEMFDAVVEPIVELPVLNKFPNAPMPVTVVEPADKLVTKPF